MRASGAFTIFSLLLFSTGASYQQSVAPEATIVEYLAPPATLAELWRTVPVVVVGQVLASNVRVVDRGRISGAGPNTKLSEAPRVSNPRVFTEHNVRILEILKNDGSLPQAGVIRVAQLAGSTTYEGRLIEVKPGPIQVLAPGDETLLFLGRSADIEGYTPIGIDGAFKVQGETVLLHEGAKRLDIAQGRPTIPRAEFLAKLRLLNRSRGSGLHSN